jgi:hypothetical protein
MLFKNSAEWYSCEFLCNENFCAMRIAEWYSAEWYSRNFCAMRIFFVRRVEDEFRKDQTPAAENEPMLGREKDCARFENFRKNVLKKE